MKSLDDSIQYLKGVGPQRFKLFQHLGIRTVSDLLAYIPRKYLDRSQIKTIKEALETIYPPHPASPTRGEVKEERNNDLSSLTSL